MQSKGQPISRRDFVELCGASLAGAALGCSPSVDEGLRPNDALVASGAALVSLQDTPLLLAITSSLLAKNLSWDEANIRGTVRIPAGVLPNSNEPPTDGSFVGIISTRRIDTYLTSPYGSFRFRGQRSGQENELLVGELISQNGVRLVTQRSSDVWMINEPLEHYIRLSVNSANNSLQGNLHALGRDFPVEGVLMRDEVRFSIKLLGDETQVRGRVSI